MGHLLFPHATQDNKKAALWGAAASDQAAQFHHPYLQYSPVEKPSSSPMESILQSFNSWSKKTEIMAHNIWHNRPVAGTLYLSDAHAAFCSDRPLSFTAPSGQETWSYYKVMVPLSKIGAINPVVMRDNPSEKYIQIVTIDGHDFLVHGFC
ncbi:hypothetical protein GH714_029661 [Hevea brasiliensis]|uniref:GRAM domain-containing protein n=1 Tax=Hevea brasiliensis TaxID=3981 RepID=A0A6A6LN03_HEVBR|nr:hypothetical protein GH714_029661 [Hevea brasiliensis]